MTAFFTLKAGELVPAPHARGPWSPDMLHGRLLGGLAARAVDEHTEPGFRAARLTVDLFRNSPLLPLTVASTVVRDGRRIRVVDVEIGSAHGKVARASAVLLKESTQPPGEVSATPAWDAGPPTGEPVGSGEWFPPFELWQLTQWGEPGPHRAWMRERFPLVEGEEHTPLVRAALAADFASPISHFGTAGLQFINADYTLTLSRLPSGPTLGLEGTGHVSADGIAAGQCTMHDESGPIGFCVVTAVANPGDRLAR
ncbi:acyl-CoA thioesterase domain-containing protein [Nonomuraea soli]|uniref:Thioesterase family protein n=1 Tax=Nonomuraea soli TaxID=1032476 RepID=A0A7W0HUP2_9ACTN|nr:acyl-CoA thioesterase domain-containing protein [Nonomuraea soli]MBA2896182.1 hypothetical protein [Nonomuraea soli]